MIRSLKLKSTLTALAAAALLAACGDSSNVSTPTANQNAVIKMDASNGDALASSLIAAGGYTFNGGVPAFGTTTATTVAIEGTPADKSFSIATTGGEKATGDFKFGSCIFEVKAVEPLSGSLDRSLKEKDEDGTEGLPYQITITPCTLTINTKGISADGSAQQVTTFLDLANGPSTTESKPVSVTINPNGDVLVGDTKIADVEVLTGTGATTNGTPAN